MPTDAQRNHGPTVRDDSSRTHPVRIPVVAGSNSATQLPPRRSSSAARRSTRSGSPPRPTLPSASSTVCHRPVPGKDRTHPAEGPGRRCAEPIRQPLRTGRPRVRALRDEPARSPIGLGRNPGRWSGHCTAPRRRCRTGRRRPPAEPASHGSGGLAVVMPDPAAFAVERAVVEVTEHQIHLPGRPDEPTVGRAYAGPRRRRRRCPHPPAREPGHINPCRKCRQRYSASVERDIGIARRQSAIAASVTPNTHQPPS